MGWRRLVYSVLDFHKVLYFVCVIPIKPSVNCMYHLISKSITLDFVHTVQSWVSYDFQNKKAIVFLNSINQLIFVTETRCFFFEVGTELLNFI
jgi:hypothetical protein